MIRDYGFATRLKEFSGKFSIKISGSGEKPLVLGNGFGADCEVWLKILPWLEDNFRVIRFNWVIDPEHYDTSRYNGFDGYAEDLLSVVVGTGSSPAIFLGHSVAGMIGMLAGKHAPHLFRKMVMISPSPCYRNHPGYPGGLDEAALGALLGQMSENYLLWTKHFAPVAVGKTANSPEVAEFSRGLLAMRPDVALSMATLIWRSDLRDQLDGFAVPTTIIQPLRDPAVPVGVGHFLVERWPHADLRLIDTDGHLPHLTHPDSVIGELVDCLNDL